MPSTPTITAAISVGDKLPESTFSYFDATCELQTVTVSDLTTKKNTILFVVPNTFTLTCSQKHLPGFIERAIDFRSKGVDTMVKAVVNQVTDNYYRPDLKNVMLARLSVDKGAPPPSPESDD
ncbi:peroxiredoxin-2E, chloroplastic-like [Magnolia sinica]|uniref:peroxiredoxin-2E, chloroplastic-like n=1 Tax=Magnolia sinica TaxID=86752 RepID=UPI00265B015C|nr:peroxiredoxin-2E, chloroplastic-like [Magnolia sinica]